MDLRGWETYVGTGGPVVGATVEVRAATTTHPNTGAVITSTTTDANGMWSFTGLTDSAKDIKVTINSRVKWLKGLTRVTADLVASRALTTRARGAVAQTINKTTQTSLNLTTETWDVDGWYNNSGTQTEMTLTREGFYLCGVNVGWADNAAAHGEARSIVLQHFTGAAWVDKVWNTQANGGGVNTNQSAWCIIKTAANNEKIRGQVYYNGVPATINTVADESAGWLVALYLGIQ